jgi:hypothetical protein
MMVRTSKQKKGGGVSTSAPPEAQADAATDVSSITQSSGVDAERVPDPEEYEPLYPPILQSSSSMFPAVPPTAFADMSFDPRSARRHIDENAPLTPADQEFVDYISTLLHDTRP